MTARGRWSPGSGRPPVGMALAVVLTLLTFRVTQPMSFRAPTGNTGFFTLHLNPDWWRNMKVAQDMNSGIGISGYPPADQWANRTPILFPLVNMVLWGMGLPLGLAACIGLVWAAIRTFQGREWQKHLLPVLIAAGMFIFLGTRWVMSVRYFLIVLPLPLFAGRLGAAGIPEDRRSRRRWFKALPAAALVVVVLGTLPWAWGFTSIYRHENTRVEASRWIYQNVPAPFDLNLNLASGATYHEPIPFYASQQIGIGPDHHPIRPARKRNGERHFARVRTRRFPGGGFRFARRDLHRAARRSAACADRSGHSAGGIRSARRARIGPARPRGARAERPLPASGERRERRAVHGAGGDDRG